jgi:hypothetical protein
MQICKSSVSSFLIILDFETFFGAVEMHDKIFILFFAAVIMRAKILNFCLLVL